MHVSPLAQALTGIHSPFEHISRKLGSLTPHRSIPITLHFSGWAPGTGGAPATGAAAPDTGTAGAPALICPTPAAPAPTGCDGGAAVPLAPGKPVPAPPIPAIAPALGTATFAPPSGGAVSRPDSSISMQRPETSIVPDGQGGSSQDVARQQARTITKFESAVLVKFLARI